VVVRARAFQNNLVVKERDHERKREIGGKKNELTYR